MKEKRITTQPFDESLIGKGTDLSEEKIRECFARLKKDCVLDLHKEALERFEEKMLGEGKER